MHRSTGREREQVPGRAIRLAFAGVSPQRTFPLARGLEEAGFTVFWVLKWRSEAEWLRAQGIPEERFLDTSRISTRHEDRDRLAAELAELEAVPGAPRMRDLMLMDRHLGRCGWDFALRYLGHLNRVVPAFLRDREVEIVSTLPDTALQILSLWTARRLGIPAVVPTPLRFPALRFGFCPSHESAEFVPVREVQAEDYAAAQAVVDEFRAGRMLVVSPRTVRDVTSITRMLPRQIRYFSQVAAWARHDAGERHHRWTLADLLRMYLGKRMALVRTRLRLDFQSRIGTRPFVLYAVHVQPESSIDVYGAFFSNQEELVRHIARSTPATHDLYVKIHLANTGEQATAFYDRLRRIPGVVVIGPGVPVRELLERCSIVFTVSGTMAYEAGLLGKHAVTFGRMFFDRLPTVHHCDAPPELPALVSRILAEPERDRTPEIVEAVAELHAASFPGEFTTRGGGKVFGPDDVRWLGEAYRALHRYTRGGVAAEGARVAAEG
ncbi:MAG TPA: hypothetical protein VEQ60_06710 [Longimicrobium sp.]|nr:hypothetical protein [Longimicrobium sp.]